MSNNAKDLKDRERRRYRANQMSKTITGVPNLDARTYKTYMDIIARDKQNRKIGKEDKKQFDENGNDYDNEIEELSSHSEDDETTGVS